MSKKLPTTGLEGASRLLDLAPYLLTHQGIEISELAREFAVPEKQILADLNTLWMCGLPGYTPLELIDISFDSGYVTIRNAETLQDPRSLDKNESLALLLGLSYLHEQLSAESAELANEITSLILKVRTSLATVSPQQMDVVSVISPSIRALIEEAIANRTSLIFNYHSKSKDSLDNREVSPVELYVENGSEYLIAFCHTANDYRNFKLDRISEISSSARQSSSHSAVTVDPARISAQIELLDFSRNVVERFPLATPTGNRIMDLDTFNVEWLVREVLSFSGEIRLLSPIEGRRLAKERAARALAQYSDTKGAGIPLL